MKKVKIGVVGIGIMGSSHLDFISNIENLELTAVCDIVKEKADKAAVEHNAKAFYNHIDLINSGLVEAVLVATPHYAHTTVSIDAFKAGLHVLTEKPVAAHIADAERMIEEYKKHPEVKWGIVFQVRTSNVYIKLKEILESGEFGRITRINYIITNWFRTQKYYDSGSWRATWSGEGGGVLLNQCPHQLDIFQCFFGMPSKLSAYCEIGKYHDIEVEDDVTAYMKFPDGATAVFITSTGDAPGTNRLEITAEHGKIIVEDEKIMVTRNKCSSLEFLKTSDRGFAKPETEVYEVEYEENIGKSHQKIDQNFANAILNDEPLIARGEEGINSLMLANAMLYSSFTGEMIDMPLDSAKYEEHLIKLIKESKFEKAEEAKLDPANFSESFNH